jgi:tetratricopeptide (TPR) repeat protein
VDTARVMELYAPADGDGEDRGGRLGSGYRAGPEVVLTAAHVVAGLPEWPAGEPVPAGTGSPGVCWARPLGEQDWISAIVAWRDADKDVAVLRLGPAAPPLPADSPPPRWGRVAGQEPIAVTAVGFPWAQERPDRVRDTEQLFGFIAPAAMAKSGLYAVTVLTAAPAARAGASPWAGVSGAALFAGPFLVGVVAVHPAHFGTDRVVAAPVAGLLADADLAALLGTTADAVAAVGPRAAAPYPLPTQVPGQPAQMPGEPAQAAGEPQRAIAAAVDTLLLPPALLDRTAELGQLRTTARQAGPRGRPVVVITVHGMGGVGKTALARSLAAEIAAEFPDIKLEIDLYGFTPGMQSRQPAEVLGELLGLAGFALADVPATTEGRSALWRSYLSTRRALLVLDNARDARQVVPLLPGSGPGRCLVLVTSRNRLAELETTAIVEVRVLPSGDAVALLVQASHRDPAQLRDAGPALHTLAALCGFLPLALRSVGTLLARLDPDDLVEVMRSAQYPLQHLSQADRTAASAYSVSYDALNVPLQDALRACASHPGPDFDADSAAALIGRPRPLVAVQLAELADSNMLADLPRHRYGFHDLFLSYARQDAEEEDGQAAMRARRERLCTRLAGRLEAAASLIYTDSQYALRQAPDAVGFADQGQARAWLTAAAGELATTAQAAMAEGLPQAAHFAMRLAYWLHADGNSDQPIALYEAVRAAAQATGETGGQADALAGLGLVTYARGEYRRAADAYRQARELYAPTGNRRAEADAVKGLADVTRVLGEYREAQDSYQQAYDLYRETGHGRGQADSLKGMGDMAYARGQARQARDDYRRAGELCARIGYRNGQADALCGIGDSAMLDGAVAEARAAFQQAHDIYVDTGNMHGLAYAYKGLGDATRVLREYEQALEWYRQGSDLYQRIGFPATHADVLRGTGDVARAQGDAGRADDLYRQAYDISTEIGYRGGEADALKAWGDLARDASDDARARDYYRRAADLYRQTGNLPGQTEAERLLNGLQ